MLRKRSSSLPSPTTNHQQRAKPTSPFLSPKLLVSLSQKSSSPCDSAMSPTSTLETKHLSSMNNPFFSFSDRLSSPRNPKAPLESTDSSPIGLGLVDALDSDKFDNMVLIGSKLRIQIPSVNSKNGIVDSPRSPIEFGIKNRESQLALLSPVRKSPLAMERPCSRVISTSEMELSEDYTCVISHGPNPRKTHIFDNCVVESNGDACAESFKDKESGFQCNYFLSFCHSCKRRLEEGKDIFMYRGEKAFCSSECRDQEMENSSESSFTL